MTGKIAVLYTLVSTKEEARRLAKQIVTEHWAACVNIFACDSVYRWEGELQETCEYALLIKTTQEQRASLVQWISQHHPYKTPAVLYDSDVSCSGDFANWIRDQVTGHVPG